MPDLRELEYTALRDTIRERGSLRMCAILIALVAWGALAIGLLAAQLTGAATMVPLVVLASGFEVSFFIHTGVERVGRYIQVFYEEEQNTTAWETSTMNYGRSFPGGMDPLFITLFAGAATVNFVSTFGILSHRPGWMLLAFVVHLAFGWRLVSASRLSRSQRGTDLERFRSLRGSSSKSAGA
jgi:hypothetical protein